MRLFKKLKTRPPVQQTKFYEIEQFDTDDLFKFKAIDSSVLSSIKTVLKLVKPVSDLEDRGSNMLLTNCKSYSNLEEVLECIHGIWKNDYSENIEKTAEEKWEFYYLFPKNSEGIDVFLIIANLYYPTNEHEANVLYNLVAVKSDGSSYFVWDMTN